MQPLVIIVGPTAVGKSALAVALAQTVGGEIISGDSVQVYRKLDIGSAKPTQQEQGNIPHHLMDCLNLDQPFTAAQFQMLANEIISDIHRRGKIPIVVGGTGLYIRSLLDPFQFAEEGSEVLRAAWTEFLNSRGKVALHGELEKRDPLSASRLHVNDTNRIIRALEISDLTGRPFSEIRGNLDQHYPPLAPSVCYVGLTAPRPLIYERINQRCLAMLEAGIIRETLSVLQEGFSPHIKPLQSIGYRHVIWYLQGKAIKDEMIRLMQRDTRHFAKRQLTWFKRDPRVNWFDTAELDLTKIVEGIIDACGDLQSRVQ